MKKLISALVLVFVVTSGALAQEVWPVEVSCFDWLARPTDVAGLRIGIPYGLNDSITGVDVGLWGQSDYAWALQFNVACNLVRDQMGGLQVGGYNQAGDLIGVQVGLWNRAATATGVQVGLLNLADQMDGFQIGVVNRVEMMHGYQIGLVNVIRESSVPCCVVVNFHF